MNERVSLVRSLFDSVLTTSWQASIVVGLIVVVSWMMRRRLSARARHGLWFVLLIKLMVPLLPSSPLSLFNWIPERVVAGPLVSGIRSIPPDQAPNPVGLPASVENDAARPIASSASTAPIKQAIQSSSPTLEIVPFWNMGHVLTWAWVVGCLFFWVQMGYQNVTFLRSLRKGKRIEDDRILALLKRHAERMKLSAPPALIESSAVTVPAVYGVWRPYLILPPGMIKELPEERLGYVLMHELAHLKRQDLLVVWIASILRTVHWFNPVIWFAVSQIRRDCEVATDALALERAGAGADQAYGETILHLLRRAGERARLPGLVGIVEGKKEIARRIISIRDFRHRPRRTVWALGVATVLAVVSLTQALPKLDSQPTETTESVVQIVCTVVDPDGNPVPNAAVELGTKDWWFVPLGETDAGGQFMIDKPKFKPDLVIRAKGFAPTLYAFDYDLTKTSRTYQLEAAATLRGVVQDADGNPIADAEVIPSSWYRFSSFERGLKTAADGTFAWREAPNHGKLYLTVFAKDFKAVRDFVTAVDGSPIIQMSKPDRVLGTVVDSETGEVIPKFRFEVGQRERAEGRVMNTRRRGEGKDGKFDVEITWPADQFHMVTVLADGYAPSVSRNFKDGDGTLQFRFELERETVLRPVVLQPDGTPASGALVVQAKEDDHEILINAPHTIDRKRVREKVPITDTERGRISEADAEGRASIKPVVEMIGVVITHESGFAEVDLVTLQSNPEIRLQPWGRVEGEMLSGGKPVGEQSLNLWRIDFKYALVAFDTVTDNEGRFAVEGIPAGEYRPERGQGTMVGWLQVDAGRTTQLVIGENTISVVGRASLKGAPIEDLNWQRDSYYLKSRLPLPEDIKAPTLEEQRANPNAVQQYMARRDAFSKSPEGRALKRTERRYAVEFDNDGSFRIEDVTPGEYELAINISERVRVGPRSTQTRHVASVRRTVHVPSPGAGANRTELDLGVLELTQR